ncbi:MAG: ABC transporter permease subunit, partial [Spirochaetaceae bacterium]|nr:ABC transporter permease subunit [Spirochaetaceae bacterium]
MYSRRGSRLRLLPLIIPIGGLFAAGAAVTVIQSFGALIPVPGMEMGTDAWTYIFADSWIGLSILHTLAVSLISAGIAVALGTILAWGIFRLPGIWRQLAAVYKIPLILPHLTIAYITIIIFGQAGFLSALTAKMGWVSAPSDFPNLLYSGHGIGVGLAYVIKETSFVILMVTGMLRKLDESLVVSARMLGASRAGVFKDIVIPHVKPAMISSFLILSLYALGAFEIPWLIGESKPQMLSVTIYNLYFQRDLSRRPEAAALLTLLMLLSA